MKLAYCVNIWNHYQDAFCREMASLMGDDFKMVLFTPTDELSEYGNTGGVSQSWVRPAPSEPWIVPPPRRADELATGPWNRLLAEADVAVVGYCGAMSREALRARERAGRPTYFMGERLFKTPVAWFDWISPRAVKRWLALHHLLSGRHSSYLEISYDGYRDLQFLHVCRGRIYQWGYFPPTSDGYVPKTPSDRLRIGWCGRMIGWKHVEYIVKAVGLLPADVRCRCDVTLVGEGPVKEALIALSAQLGLNDVIRFETYKTVAETMDFMRSLDVYAFPSDRGEGWGVALMEAMDKGCVPVANAAAGATLALVKDGINGFVFDDGDVRVMSEAIARIVQHRSDLARMSRAAWETMQSWSPRNAARILLHMTEGGSVPAEGLGSLRG